MPSRASAHITCAADTSFSVTASPSLVARDTARRQDVQSSGRCSRGSYLHARLHRRTQPPTLPFPGRVKGQARPTLVSRIQVLERRPAPMEHVGHSSAASETFRFWPPGRCLVCHVSWTGLKQCPDSPQQSFPGSVMEGVNAEVWLAPLAAFTVVSRPFVYCVSALLQITARIPSWHHGAVDLSAPRPTVRFASAISDDVDGGAELQRTTTP